MLRLIRRFIYTYTSYRPKFGTILYSPTLDFRMWWKDLIKRNGSIMVLGDGPVFTSLHTKEILQDAVLPPAEARLFPRVPTQSQQPAVQLRPGGAGALEDGQAVIEGLDNIKDPSDDQPADLTAGITIGDMTVVPHPFDPSGEPAYIGVTTEPLNLTDNTLSAEDQITKIRDLIESMRPEENLDPRVAEDLAVVKHLYDYAPEQFTYSWEELRPRLIRRIERMYRL